MRAYYRDAQEGYLLLTQYQPEHPSSSCIGGDLKSINRGGVFLVTTSPKIRILLEQPSISHLAGGCKWHKKVVVGEFEMLRSIIWQKIKF